MKVREFRETDLKAIEEIHGKYHEMNFEMPDVAEAYATSLIEDEGKILGFGMIREITESIMVLDLSLPMRTKYEVLKELIKESVMKSKHPGIHSFVELPTFEDVLKKHYGYKTCKGSALYLEK